MPGGFRAVVVALGVFEGALGVGVAISVLLHAWWSWTTRAEIRGLHVTIAEVMPTLRRLLDAGDPSEAIEDVRDEITDTINTVLGNMHVPKAQDHFWGMAAQLMQMWGLSRMTPGGALAAVAEGAADAVSQTTEPPEP